MPQPQSKAHVSRDDLLKNVFIKADVEQVGYNVRMIRVLRNTILTVF